MDLPNLQHFNYDDIEWAPGYDRPCKKFGCFRDPISDSWRISANIQQQDLRGKCSAWKDFRKKIFELVQYLAQLRYYKYLLKKLLWDSNTLKVPPTFIVQTSSNSAVAALLQLVLYPHKFLFQFLTFLIEGVLGSWLRYDQNR